MRRYVAVSGSVFGLVVAAHVARLAFEGAAPLGDAAFVVSTLLAAALALWALLLLVRR